MVPPVRKKLGTGSPGKVVPGSSFTIRETGWDAKCTLSKCGEVPLWRRCASPWAPEETPAGEGGVGGAQEWPPCDSTRICHQEGFLPISMFMSLGSHYRRIQPVSILLGDLCPYLGHSVKDVVAKHSEVMRDAKGK